MLYISDVFRVNKASQDKKTLDVGANIFVGNLDPEIDEKALYDVFGSFGVIVNTPKVMREDTGISKGYAFLGYDSFDSSDAAIAAMNGQYLGGRPIHVTYALRKDSKKEKHGSQAERILAANNPNTSKVRPTTTLLGAPITMIPPPNSANLYPPPPAPVVTSSLVPPSQTPTSSLVPPPFFPPPIPMRGMMPQGFIPPPPFPFPVPKPQ
jgi:splicing factor 3B subunit 4